MAASGPNAVQAIGLATEDEALDEYNAIKPQTLLPTPLEHTAVNSKPMFMTPSGAFELTGSHSVLQPAGRWPRRLDTPGCCGELA